VTDDQGQLCARLDCGTPQHDGLLCTECTRHLMGCIRTLIPTDNWTGLADQLQINLTRQSKRGSVVGGRSNGDRPMPFDISSSKAIRDLRWVLRDWALGLLYAGETLDARTLPELAQWFLNHRDRIRAWQDRQQLTNLWHGITDIVHRANRVIDARPTYQFVGPCPICDRGDVYAPASAETGVCRACAEVITGIPDMRRANEVHVQQLLVDRAQLWRQILPSLDDVYGLAIKPGTVKKWIQRGKLIAERVTIATVYTDEDGEHYLRVEPVSLYRVGDVLDLAADLRGTNAGGAA
jgi:hypothetical protein